MEVVRIKQSSARAAPTAKYASVVSVFVPAAQMIAMVNVWFRLPAADAKMAKYAAKVSASVLLAPRGATINA
jgi:hypothetical protein